MWDTCKKWWEGKIKVEVDEVRFLHRSRCRDPPSSTTLGLGDAALRGAALGEAP
jgi:hypothetical protein